MLNGSCVATFTVLVFVTCPLMVPATANAGDCDRLTPLLESSTSGGWVVDRAAGCGVFLDAVLVDYWQFDDLTAVRYRGGCERCMASGTGRLTWTQGFRSEDCNEAVGEDRDTFEGEYDGSFRHGRMHGRGNLELSHGGKYVGDWLDGLPHGQGVASDIWCDGARYEGAWARGRRHGQGVLTRRDRSTYRGTFRQGTRHGQGHYRAHDGGEYSGLFEDGSPACRVLGPPGGDWRLDTGGCVNGLAQGIGTARAGSDDEGHLTYSGAFDRGYFHGHGTLVGESEPVRSGPWRLSKRHGAFELRWPSEAPGVVCRTEYTDGRPIREGSACTYTPPPGVSPNAMYVLATSLDVDRATPMYRHLVDRHPDLDIAVRAADRLRVLRSRPPRPTASPTPSNAQRTQQLLERMHLVAGRSTQGERSHPGFNGRQWHRQERKDYLFRLSSCTLHVTELYAEYGRFEPDTNWHLSKGENHYSVALGKLITTHHWVSEDPEYCACTYAILKCHDGAECIMTEGRTSTEIRFVMEDALKGRMLRDALNELSALHRCRSQ